ncbi:fibronectin type III domain-containing protein [Campylobacter ureolyticus]|uniref:fibronectin type III domain-containing protein n=1 Tax=Campylobacter ureolyticus TaxID=827 RepID=UPI0022B34489|nr:hypothetical protein [Campylobacter ureolyticus]MCZ6110898.1 hypothetical protein [Campylobacter ureolyticus]MDK8323646.1 hypothetical protein [Campylobacter ureolyticus]
MKNFHQILLSVVLMIFIAGCASHKVPMVKDSSLPVINDIRTVSSSKSIGLEWSNPKDLDVMGYYIYRANLNEPLKLVGTIKDRFATHYLDDGLSPATTYRYTIKTFGQNGISADGIVVSASTSKGIETVSFAQAIYGLPERVKLIWRPHANLKVGSYIIERRKDEKSSWSKKAEVKGRLSAEYIDNSVKSGEMYQYRIRVKTLDGDISEPSNVLTAQTKELPLGVINLQATVDQPKKIILTWDSPLNEAFSHYQIYTSRGSILPLVPLAKTDKNSYEDLINANGAKRYYKVTLVDKDGLESLAQDEAIMGQTLAAAKAPVLGEPIIEKNSISLNWHTGANYDKFVLTRDGGSSTKTVDNIKTMSYVDREVAKGTKYSYRVYSVDEYGINSNVSNKMSVEF